MCWASEVCLLMHVRICNRAVPARLGKRYTRADTCHHPAHGHMRTQLYSLQMLLNSRLAILSRASAEGTAAAKSFTIEGCGLPQQTMG